MLQGQRSSVITELVLESKASYSRREMNIGRHFAHTIFVFVFLFLLFVCFCFLLEEDSAKACPLRFGDQTYKIFMLVFYWVVWALNWSPGVARVTVMGESQRSHLYAYAAMLHIRPNLFHAVLRCYCFCILLFLFCFLFRFGNPCKRRTKKW